VTSCKFRSLACLGLLALAACSRTTIAHTPGEIPRDTNGKPIWSLIEPSAPRPPTR
jgi:hypothetical protein